MANFVTPVNALMHWQKQHPQRVYLRQPIDGVYHEKTWAMVAREAGQIAQGIRSLGLEPGDKVAILAKNSAEWFIADLAIMMAGCISIPIYSTASADTVSFILKHSESKLLFVGKLDEWNKQAAGVPVGLKTVAMPYPTMPCHIQWSDWLAKQAVIDKHHLWHEQDTMTIIYTSGSTGDPKGAEISFAAYRYACEQLIEVLQAGSEDRVMSYLPLAHITERVYIQGTSIFSGQFSVSFVESLDTFADNLRSVQPTLFVSVPRLWARFQQGVFEKLPPKKLKLLLAIPLVSGLIKAKIKKALGLNKARILGCGSAPIAPSLLRWYQSIGLNISEAWGMTENLAYGTLNLPFRSDKIGTIGKAGPGVEIKISEQGEILAKGQGMMSGYYKHPELNEQTIVDGWLHTGDKGSIDADGYVKIIGRLKESFKTAKGKYVAPVPIEQKLAENSMVEQVCVVGSALAQPCALVVLAGEMKQHSQAQIEASLGRTLDKVNQHLESHAKLSHILVVKQDWNVDNALLTPTLKIRRNQIEQHYSELIHQQFTSKVAFEAGSW
ncbi:AMP-binding protein [Agarivorans gilvus]|jgi:long-chain acyl-CoA synthetase|uniref:Long-chain acyl-CoA synthetase n=1 Tax=Agarivorans gilvus TaxID=680279 RepID=A0ABQ1I667_9ALTE|nr:AMP-binding protein [Agarivorans gilvus]GGB15088.1 long-chain acyl-CoA synthetase [Agarivorans gilvus]